MAEPFIGEAVISILRSLLGGERARSPKHTFILHLEWLGAERRSRLERHITAVNVCLTPCSQYRALGLAQLVAPPVKTVWFNFS